MLVKRSFGLLLICGAVSFSAAPASAAPTPKYNVSIFLNSVTVKEDGDGWASGAGEFSSINLSADTVDGVQPRWFSAKMDKVPFHDGGKQPDYQVLAASSSPFTDMTPVAATNQWNGLNYIVLSTSSDKLTLRGVTAEWDVGDLHRDADGKSAFARPAPGGSKEVVIDVYGTNGGVGEPIWLQIKATVVTGSSPI